MSTLVEASSILPKEIIYSRPKVVEQILRWLKNPRFDANGIPYLVGADGKF